MRIISTIGLCLFATTSAQTASAQMQIINTIPGIDGYAFHEALLLENYNLWPALER